MTEDEMTLAVLREWSINPSRKGTGEGVDLPVLHEMARVAARTLAAIPVECCSPHPIRPALTCTEVRHQTGEHRNDAQGLSWNDDGWTFHDVLGEITLVDQTAYPATDTTDLDPDDERTPESIAGPAAEMLETLRIAEDALRKVEDAYPGRMTAALVNWVRPASRRCAASAASLDAALTVMADRG